MTSFYGWGSTASRLQSHYEEAVYFLPLSSQKFPVLIWSTSKGWKAGSTLEPQSGFEHGTPGLGIQRLVQLDLRWSFSHCYSHFFQDVASFWIRWILNVWTSNGQTIVLRLRIKNVLSETNTLEATARQFSSK